MMKKTLSVVALVSLFAAGSAMASGYRIPEQSADSTAKSGANIASANGADTTYYNPAGMSALPDTWLTEVTGTFLHLTPIDYEDNRTPLFNGSSEEEYFLLPTFFVVSPDYNNFRFGFSVTEPYGLSKRWQSDPFPKTFADKFELAVFEFNPTVSYKFSDMFSIGAGARMLYNRATVMSVGLVPGAGGATAGRYVDGDTTEFGYNLAVDLKANDNWNFAITYRSNVDLDFDGDVQLFTNTGPSVFTTGSVSVPAPAVLAFSAAYTCDKWIFDLTVDQTYWSEYEALDFDYDVPITNPLLFVLFDRPAPKEWDDTIAVRLGVEYMLDAKTSLMAGFAYDENPIPEENVNFELPDSDAWLFSVGARYAINSNMEIAAGLLYDYKEERDVVNRTINGTFSNASAYLFSLGLSYKF